MNAFRRPLAALLLSLFLYLILSTAATASGSPGVAASRNTETLIGTALPEALAGIVREAYPATPVFLTASADEAKASSPHAPAPACSATEAALGSSRFAVRLYTLMHVYRL